MNYAILGTWGLGKTSLLYKFKQIIEDEFPRDVNCLCVSSSLSPQICNTWESFSTAILRSVQSAKATTQRKTSKVIEELKSWSVSLKLPGVEFSRKLMPDTPNLTDALEKLWENHLQPSGIDIAFFLLDDLHYFPLESGGASYLNIRNMFQELVSRGCNYSLCITAHSALFTQIAELAEPLLRFFKPFYLKPFNPAEIKEVIEKRLSATNVELEIHDSAIEFLSNKTAGHPYLIMFVMFELLNETPNVNKITEDDFQRVWPQIEENLGKSIFEQKYLSASEKERELLTKIAKAGKGLTSANDFKDIRGVNVLLSRLEQKELLLKPQRGKYALFHPLFAEFLKNK